MKNSNIRVNTERFFWAHGKQPKGNGNWFFSIGNNETEFWFHGTYGNAKAAAKKEAIEKGETFITVGS